MRLPFGLCALLLAIASASAGERITTAPGGGYAVDATPPTAIHPLVVTAGWQPKYLYVVPPATTSLFFHFPCPGQFPVVWNGAFAFVAANGDQTQQVFFQYNGPRLDEKPTGYGEWGWHFYWPSGWPNPTNIIFAPFCQASQSP